MSERASGWYPDPDDPNTLRYWDGVLWTDRTMPRVKPGLEDSHLTQPPVVPQQGYPPHHQQHQGGGIPAYAVKQAPRTPDGQELAAWWRRALAMMIDNVITFVISIPLAWTWLSPWIDSYTDWIDRTMDAIRDGKDTPSLPDSVLQFPWQIGLVTVAVYLVYEVSMTVWRGQTLGKMVLGIKVRRTADERPPNLPTALYRFGVKQISSILSPAPFVGFVATVFQIVDYLRPLGDRYNQAFHDSWPGTYVVRVTKTPKTPAAQQFGPPQ